LFGEDRDLEKRRGPGTGGVGGNQWTYVRCGSPVKATTAFREKEGGEKMSGVGGKGRTRPECKEDKEVFEAVREVKEVEQCGKERSDLQ